MISVRFGILCWYSKTISEKYFEQWQVFICWCWSIVRWAVASSICCWSINSFREASLWNSWWHASILFPFLHQHASILFPFLHQQKHHSHLHVLDKTVMEPGCLLHTWHLFHFAKQELWMAFPCRWLRIHINYMFLQEAYCSLFSTQTLNRISIGRAETFGEHLPAWHLCCKRVRVANTK